MIADHTIHTELFFLEKTATLELEGGDLFFDIVKSADPVLEIIGTDWFHENLSIHPLADGVRIITPKPRQNTPRDDDPIEGKLIFKISSATSLRIENYGRGVGRIKIPITRLEKYTYGAMKLMCTEAIDSAIVKIHGSSNTTLQTVSQSADLRINGSGYIGMLSGQLNDFAAQINGSGRINANVTAQKASLGIAGSGSIVVHRVIGNVHQSCTGSGFIHVLNR